MIRQVAVCLVLAVALGNNIPSSENDGNTKVCAKLDVVAASNLTSDNNQETLTAIVGLIESTSKNNDNFTQRLSRMNGQIEESLDDVLWYVKTQNTCSSDDCAAIRGSIQDIETSVNDLQSRLEKLENTTNDLLQNNGQYSANVYPVNSDNCALPATLKSCLQLQGTSCPSGYYIITDSSGSTHCTYCNMRQLCGDSSGGWRRIGYLDMSNPVTECPTGFKYYNESGIRACGKYQAGCTSVNFPSNGISYTQVCGRVIGYQFGSPDAAGPSNDIDGAYLDGISLTKSYPREHIWSFYASGQENALYNNDWSCPCATGNPASTELFVGNDYFCESGCPEAYSYGVFYGDDPLWDGQQCGLIEEDCCSSEQPWFHRSFGNSTSDFIELRICTDESPSNEDVPVAFYEIYTK